MNIKFSILTIAAVALVTILLRFIPFLIFDGKKQAPKSVEYLGSVLPYAIMAMLVVYCLKSVSIAASPFGLPELISCALVVVVHLWRKDTLISVVAGTVIYMVLIQLVF